MKLNVRTEARIEARAILEVHYPTTDVNFLGLVEDLDSDSRFRHLAFSSLEGAVRAAAKELGRKIEDGYILKGGNYRCENCDACQEWLLAPAQAPPCQGNEHSSAQRGN